MKKVNKIRFLNRKKFKFNWNHDEIDHSENLIEELVHVDMLTQFLGIELESELEITGLTVIIFPETIEQEVHGATVNTGINKMLTRHHHL